MFRCSGIRNSLKENRRKAEIRNQKSEGGRPKSGRKPEAGGRSRVNEPANRTWRISNCSSSIFMKRNQRDINEEDISGFIDDHIIRLGYSASYQNIIISAIKIYFSLCGLRRFYPDSVERPRRRPGIAEGFFERRGDENLQCCQE